MPKKSDAASGMGKYIALTIAGAALLVVCAILGKQMRDEAGLLQTLPYLGIGVGAGIFGQNLGAICQRLALRKEPALAKQMEIEEKDERNTAIRNRAKAKAYDLMIWTFGALMLAFALTRVELYATLALVAAYLFVVFAQVYYLAKFQKEM